MLSLYNIVSIARFEMKNLLRSWFFRIFFLLSLFIIVMLDIAMFTLPMSPWMFRALPSSIPYLNLMLLNVVQAIIGGFLASDFMKYDSKLDTTDVIYMRSMTNADYVFGKTLGVFMVFGLLNIIVLLIAFIINVFFTDVPFLPVVYGLYPLLISLPTLMFIFGLSFIIMSLIRNQAVTFVLLLGYIASTLFFLGNKFHYLFDYMAINVPLMYSDIVGFGNITTILIHRGIYFLFGLGFIFTTVLFLKRLPQSRFINKLSLALAICSVAGALILGHIYLARLSSGKNLRSKINEINRNEVFKPEVSLKTCAITLNHTGKSVDAEAHLVFKNNTSNAINQYVFSLNPGLMVNKILYGGNDIMFSRNLHIISVEPSTALSPGTIDSLTITYSGKIDENACYPDIADSTREANFKVMLYNIGKRYSFITPRYVLLTPESLWYPVAGVPFGASYPHLRGKDFINFTLRIKTAGDLTAISQGVVSRGSEGEFIFTPEVQLPQLSLAIGQYEKRTATVDDVEYNLYTIKGHGFFAEYFPSFGKELSEVISSTRLRYEDTIGMSYPYHRFSLIETPIQFLGYPRFWTLTQETVQPEQILLPEKGMTLMNVDFKQFSFFMNRMVQRGQQAMTPEEIQSNQFRRFVTLFTSSTSQIGFRQRGIGIPQQGGAVQVPRISLGGVFNISAYYSLFPLYYTYSHSFSSDRWPVFTTVMELYINGRTENQSSPFGRFMTGLSDEERANLELTKRSLSDILAQPNGVYNIGNILKNKTNYLFAVIQNEVSTEKFTAFLKEYLEKSRFQTVSVDDFISALKNQFSFDLESRIDPWLLENHLPAFIISDPIAYEIIENEKTRYQVNLTISNPESAEGLVSVSFRLRGGGFGGMGGGRGGGGGRGSAGDRTAFMMFMGGAGSGNERFIILRGGETKEIGFVLDDRPGAVTVNTLISQNIPSVIENNFGRIESNTSIKPFDGENIINRPVNLAMPGEIIVDNEDYGFETVSQTSESYIKKLLKNNNQDDETYIGLQFWNMPRKWRATTSSDFYGTYKRSAHYIRAGEGANKVIWNAEIPKSGRYNVYYHVANIRMPMMRRGGERGGGGQQQEDDQDYHFTVFNDDGEDKVNFNLSGAQEGWNLLGSYYFSQGPAKVELSDESKGRLVYADAVKWTLSEQ